MEKACGSDTEGPFTDHSEIVEQDQEVIEVPVIADKAHKTDLTCNYSIITPVIMYVLVKFIYFQGRGCCNDACCTLHVRACTSCIDSINSVLC